MKTTPKPRATKNSKGELVGPPPPPPSSSLSLLGVGDGIDTVDVGSAMMCYLSRELVVLAALFWVVLRGGVAVADNGKPSSRLSAAAMRSRKCVVVCPGLVM